MAAGSTGGVRACTARNTDAGSVACNATTLPAASTGVVACAAGASRCRTASLAHRSSMPIRLITFLPGANRTAYQLPPPPPPPPPPEKPPPENPDDPDADGGVVAMVPTVVVVKLPMDWPK